MPAKVAPSFISFKLSFNKRAKVLMIDPAGRTFGDQSSGSNEVIGVRIQILEGKVFFQAVTQAEVDVNPYNVVEISDRDRGGAIAIIEGQNAASLQRALFNPCGSRYFILQPTATGWIEAVPHLDPTREPDRFTPNVSVWNQKPSGRQTLMKAGSGAAAASAAPPLDFSTPAVPKPTQILQTVRMLAENLTSVAETSGSDMKRLTDTLLEAQRIINSLVSPLQILSAPLPEHATTLAPVAEKVPESKAKPDPKAEAKPRQTRKVEATPIAPPVAARSTSKRRDEEGDVLTREHEASEVVTRRPRSAKTVSEPQREVAQVQPPRTSRSTGTQARSASRRAEFFR